MNDNSCDHTFITRTAGQFICRDCGTQFKYLPNERPVLAIATELLNSFNLGAIDLRTAANQAKLSMEEFAEQFLTYMPSVEREWHELLDLAGNPRYVPYKTPSAPLRTSCPLEVDIFFKHKQNVLRDYHRLFPDITDLSSSIKADYSRFEITVTYVDSSRQLVLVDFV